MGGHDGAEYAAVAAAAVGVVGGLVPVVAQVLIELGIQRRLNGDLGQHLAELVEVLLGLEGFGRLACEGFQFFLVHVAYPYPVRVQ